MVTREELSVHVRAFGIGMISIGAILALIMSITESRWYLLLLLLLVLIGWVVWRGEEAPKE